MNEKLLTVSQAAALKGVSRSAVYKAIADGRLPHQVILGHTALKEVDIVAWTPIGRVRGTTRSAEVKAKISLGQQKRWEQRKSDSGDYS